MDTVFSYVYRRPNISSGNGRVTPDAPTSMIPCTPPRPTNDDQADDESEIFLTPESRLPYEDCSGRRGNPERPSLILQPDSLSTSKIKVPSLFSPLVSKKLLDESREAEISSSVPVTPEGLRPRPTVVEMRAILCLDQKPTSYQNHHSIGNLTDLKSVAAQDRHRASILPSISDLDLVIYNAANSMSLSVLTQSPQIQRKRERTTRMSPPPISFGSPSFYPSSVSKGVRSCETEDFTGVAASPNLTKSFAQTAVGLAVAESFDEENENNVNDTGRGAVCSPNLTRDGARTAVGLAVAESFDEENENNVNDTGRGAVCSPNLTRDGARTAVGLAVAESFDEENEDSVNGGSTCHSVVGVVEGRQVRFTEAKEYSATGNLGVLPPRDWSPHRFTQRLGDEKEGGLAGSCWFSQPDPCPVEEKQSERMETSNIEVVPSSSFSVASSAYEEEGDRLARNANLQKSNSASMTPPSTRSKDTEQTPGSAARTWEHYQQYYANEIENEDSGVVQEEYSRLNLPVTMTQSQGDVDVSQDLSFSSRQPLFVTKHSQNVHRVRPGIQKTAYDFETIGGVDTDFPSVDGSSIRPVSSLDGRSGNNENVKVIDHLPSSPPSVPAHGKDLDHLPLSPPSLNDNWKHDLDTLPPAPPSIPDAAYVDVMSLPKSPPSVQQKGGRSHQHHGSRHPRDVIDMSHIIVTQRNSVNLDSTYTSALSQGSGIATMVEHDTASVRAAQNDCDSISTTSKIDAEFDFADGHNGVGAVGRLVSTQVLDENLMRRKRQNQGQAAKEKHLINLMERMRDEYVMVEAICAKKGLEQGSISLLGGYNSGDRDDILSETDIFISSADELFGEGEYDHHEVKKSMTFLQMLVESAPDQQIAPEGESHIQTPRVVSPVSCDGVQVWKANTMLKRALGLEKFASPESISRGQDTSLFTLPTDVTPSAANLSMATTISSHASSMHKIEDDNNLTAVSRRLKMTMEAVVILLQQLSFAAGQLGFVKRHDANKSAAALEKIESSYQRLMSIPSEDVRCLVNAFSLEDAVPLRAEKRPPVLLRGTHGVSQLGSKGNVLGCDSPKENALVEGEIFNPPMVTRSTTSNEVCLPSLPCATMSEEEEEEINEDDGSEKSEASPHSRRILLLSFDEADSIDESNCSAVVMHTGVDSDLNLCKEVEDTIRRNGPIPETEISI